MPAIINKEIDTTIKKGLFSNTGLDKEKLSKRAKALKAESQKFDSTWKELKSYIYPTLGAFNNPIPNDGSKIDNITLIDEEATLAVDTFASGMMSGFTSPSRPWFKLRMADKELMGIDSVKYWIDDAENKLYDIYSTSNTYSVLTMMFKGLSTFSNACAYIAEDFDTVIRLHNYTVGEYSIGRDANGKPNAFYRTLWMTVGQMVSKFGLYNLSPANQNQWNNNNSDNWVMVHHMIEENDDRIPFLQDYANMPFRSVYWEEGNESDSYLKIGGYEEFPILAPRFEVTTLADIFGKGGPGWKALGSIKELQKKVKEQLIGLAKQNNPPLQKDANIQGDVNTLPGGITTSSSMAPNAGVRPTYQVNLNLSDLDASIEKTKEKIRKFFFADLFLMMISAERSGTPVSATEIVERQSERLSVLGPLLEMWQGEEFIKSLIDRTFNICLRNNIFDEPPPEMEGKELKIEYVSILAQAQKGYDISAIDQYIASIAEEAGINPNSLDIVNFDEKNKLKAEMMGISPKIINSFETMAAIRKAKAEAQAQAEQNQRMMMMAEAAAKGGKAVESLSKAETGKGSVLDKTMESMQAIRENQ